MRKYPCNYMEHAVWVFSDTPFSIVHVYTKSTVPRAQAWTTSWSSILIFYGNPTLLFFQLRKSRILFVTKNEKRILFEIFFYLILFQIYRNPCSNFNFEERFEKCSLSLTYFYLHNYGFAWMLSKNGQCGMKIWENSSGKSWFTLLLTNMFICPYMIFVACLNLW